MIKLITGVLTQEELHQLRDEISGMDFVDGKYNAHGMAKEAKNNSQLSPKQYQDFLATLSAKIRNSKKIMQPTMAAKMSPVSVTRYTEGMAYGAHIDAPAMGEVRTDFSMTLFLSDPDSYDGGELILESELGEARVKLPAGDAVIYPSDRLHRVSEVSRGQRLAVISWIQSRVYDPLQREILLDLRRSLSQIKKSEHFKDNEVLALRMAKALTNLERMWME